MGVSRGSFYWHFADIGAFHAAILKHWREVAAEQIIADVEAASPDDNAAAALLRRAFGGRLALESAVRTWATVDAGGARRRAGHRPAPAGLCRERCSTQAGLAADVARARAQILYWAFLGFALSDKPLPQARQAGRARRTAADRLAIMTRCASASAEYATAVERPAGDNA